jgi:hypothetical protein
LINNKREKSLWDPQNFFGLNVPNEVKVSHFTTDGVNITDINSLANLLGRNISIFEYNAIKTVFVDSWSLVKKFSSDEPSLSLTEFLSRFKKGLKLFRKIFDRSDADLMEKKQNRRVKTFFSIIELPVPEKNCLEAQLMLWANNSFPASLREFILKFKFNILGLNTRVAHFNANIARCCTFCVLNTAGGGGGSREDTGTGTGAGGPSPGSGRPKSAR